MTETINARTKSAVYEDMLDLLNKGHVKRVLENSDGVCLVGAANKAAVKNHAPDASMLVQEEMARAIAKRFPHYARAAKMVGDPEIASDGGLDLVELWNDAPWRRTRAVIKLVESLARQARDEARDELVAELTAIAEQLKAQHATLLARVEQLESENERLRAENGELRTELSFWKKAWNGRRSKIAARELREASDELAGIDAHLDSVLTELLATTA